MYLLESFMWLLLGLIAFPFIVSVVLDHEKRKK